MPTGSAHPLSRPVNTLATDKRTTIVVEEDDDDCVDDDEDDAPIMPNFRPHLYPRAMSSGSGGSGSGGSGSPAIDNGPHEGTVEPDVIPAAGYYSSITFNYALLMPNSILSLP